MITPIKIFSIEGEDWTKGISIHQSMAVGGIFADAVNHDPFKLPGYNAPNSGADTIGNDTATTTTKWWLNAADSLAAPTLYTLGDGPTMYSVTITGGAVENHSAELAGGTVSRGIGFYQNRLLYASDSVIRSTSLDPDSTNDVLVVSGLSSQNHVMEMMADGYMYFINRNNIGRIIDSDTTTGNSAAVFAFDTDIILRDIISDGRYALVCGDNNSSQAATQHSRCIPAWWDLASPNLVQIHELNDPYVIGMQKVEEDILLFTRSQPYLMSIGMKPKPINNLLSGVNYSIGGARPTGPHTQAITKRNNAVIWVAGDTNVYAYGREMIGQDKIFFKPFTADVAINSIGITGTDAYVSVNSGTNKLRKLGATSDGQGTSIVEVAKVDFNRPYQFAYAKVIARDPLATGQSFQFRLRTQNDQNTVSALQVWDTSNGEGMTEHIFYPSPATDSSQEPYFNHLYKIYLENRGMEIGTVEIYGIPLMNNQAGI